MYLPKILLMAPLCIALAACSGGGGGSSSSGSSATSSGSGSGSGGGSGSSSSDDTVVGLDMPSQVDVVTASDDDSSVNAQLRALDFVRTLRAFSDPETDYSTDEQFIHTWHPGLEPINTVNSILCFISQIRGDEMVGEGAYAALIDDSDCETGESSGSSSSSSGNQSTAADNSVSFVEVVARATREDNDSPMIVEAWIPEMEVGGDGEGDGGDSEEEATQTIKLKIVVSEAPSDDNPIGQFHMSFGFFESASETDADARSGGGELATTTDDNGRVGFTLYESSEQSFGPGMSGNFQQLASVFTDEDRTSGDAITSMTMELDDDSEGFGEFGMPEDFASFGLSFDENHVLIAEEPDLETLINGTAESDLCLSRTDHREAVWRYDLYWAQDSDTHAAGDRIELNSGFPFRYDSDGNGDADSFGYVGYWGIWTEGDQSLPDGTEIERENFGNPEAEPDVYTVQTAGGRLIKNTVETLALTELDGIQFHYWDESLWSPGSDVSYDQWVVEYLAASDDRATNGAGWYKVGGMSFGGGPGGSEGGPMDCPEGEEGHGEGESEMLAMVEEGDDEGMEGEHGCEPPEGEGSESEFVAMVAEDEGDSEAGEEEDFGGPQIETLDTAVKLTFNFEGERLHMWSEQLGGGVEFQQGASEITFFREEFVDGTQSEFDESTTLNLVCYEQCPVGTLGMDELETWQGPFVGFNHEEIFIDDGFVCDEGEDCGSEEDSGGEMVAMLDDEESEHMDCLDENAESGDSGSDVVAMLEGDEGEEGMEPCPRFEQDFLDLIVDDFEITTYAYTYSTTGDNALTLVRTENGEPVVFADDVTRDELMSTPHSWGIHSASEASSIRPECMPHSWGIHSGRMLEASEAEQLSFMFPWEIYDSNRVTTFYFWETGLDQWNRLSIVRDSEGDIQEFDRPIEFVYEHSNENDRSPVGRVKPTNLMVKPL